MNRLFFRWDSGIMLVTDVIAYGVCHGQPCARVRLASGQFGNVYLVDLEVTDV
jgi:hypothetical protein